MTMGLVYAPVHICPIDLDHNPCPGVSAGRPRTGFPLDARLHVTDPKREMARLGLARNVLLPLRLRKWPLSPKPGDFRHFVGNPATGTLHALPALRCVPYA